MLLFLLPVFGDCVFVRTGRDMMYEFSAGGNLTAFGLKSSPHGTPAAAGTLQAECGL